MNKFTKNILLFVLLLSARFIPAAAYEDSASLFYKTGKDYFDKGEYDSAMVLFKTAAKSGDHEAQKMLGMMYLEGLGTAAGPEEGIGWYELAAGEEDEEAGEILCGIFQDRYQDPEKAAKWCGRAEEDDADEELSPIRVMQTEMAKPTSTPVPTDTPTPTETPKPTAVPIKTADPTGTAVDRSFAKNSYEQGMEYYWNEEYESAFPYIRSAADQGLADAQLALGYMYEYGQGVEQSYEKAAEYYRSAADQGLADAQNNLGLLYENGQGVEQSYEKAAEYYRSAADQGLAEAQKNLGLLYANGQGVEQSYEKAAEYYRSAADQGLADAQLALGYMYANGQGVEQSYEKAAEYCRAAADQGNAVGQNNLGDLYEKGQGVEQSYEKAAEYYQAAADGGNEEAQNKLKN